MRRSIVIDIKVKSLLFCRMSAAELVSEAGLGLGGSHLDVRARSYEAVMREVPNLHITLLINPLFTPSIMAVAYLGSDRVCTSSER